MPYQKRNTTFRGKRPVGRPPGQKKMVQYKKRQGSSVGGTLSAKTLMRPVVEYHSTPIPHVMITKFKYNDFFAMSTNALSTVNTSVIYRLNSPYDPLYAAGGLTAGGWNQVAKLYQNYIVLGCYVNITFTDPSNDGLYVGIRFRQQNDNTPVGEGVATLKNTKQTYIAPLNNSGNQVKTYKFFIRPWILTAQSKSAYIDEVENTSLTSDKPINDNVLMDVFCLNANASVQTINTSVELTYITRLWNPVYQPQSVI